MSAVLEREILETLKQINSKLDALEEKVAGAEEPEDAEAYHEAERELKEGKLNPSRRNEPPQKSRTFHGPGQSDSQFEQFLLNK